VYEKKQNVSCAGEGMWGATAKRRTLLKAIESMKKRSRWPRQEKKNTDQAPDRRCGGEGKTAFSSGREGKKGGLRAPTGWSQLKKHLIESLVKKRKKKMTVARVASAQGIGWAGNLKRGRADCFEAGKGETRG